MKQSASLIDYLIFTLLFLLLFFVIFESYLVLPAFFQVLGRAHPLFLHLPIGFLIILGLLPLLKHQLPENSLQIVRSFLLDITTLGLALSALAGLFLAQEEGYQSAGVNWHKWSALTLSFVTYALLLWNRYYPERTKVYYPVLYTNLGIMLLAGHLGGNLTHGKDFLLAPVKANKPQMISEEMPLYTAMIQPILDAKCVKCHSTAKSKGELILVDQKSILTGGKHGPVFIAGNADSSELIRRLHLPKDDEYHMPPEDQVQLTPAETRLLHEWIQGGADFQQKIADLEKEGPLFAAFKPLWDKVKNQETTPAGHYDFAPLKQKTLSNLNTPFRTVRPIAMGSPALSAEFFIAQSYKPTFLKELLVAKQQVISINLSNMPIENDALEILGQFPQVEKLILNGTPIDGKNLEELIKCKQLKELALSNTSINQDQLSVLSSLSQLKTLYLWNTSVKPEDLPALKASLPGVELELGYQADPTEVLQLSRPRFLNKNTVLKEGELIQLESKVPGTTIRYTVDGSEPDSLESSIYEQAIKIDAWATVKAKAYNPGWQSSETAALSVFSAGKTPDTVLLRTNTARQYKGLGGLSLMDKAKGKITNFRTNAWLGFRAEPLESLIDFGPNPPSLKEVVGSFGQNMGSEIFLPASVEIWGGNSPEGIQLLKRKEIAFTDGYKPRETKGIELNFEPVSYRYYVFKANPHKQLPSWHGAFKSGRKTWVFIDEIFFF